MGDMVPVPLSVVATEGDPNYQLAFKMMDRQGLSFRLKWIH